MVIEASFAANAPEVAFKPEAASAITAEIVRIMLFVIMSSFAVRSPFVNIKSLPSHQVVKSALFRPPGDEFELITKAFLTFGGLLLLSDLSLVVFAEMATEAS